jgi:hypothetical protein
MVAMTLDYRPVHRIEHEKQTDIVLWRFLFFILFEKGK